jgi:hypothetical protein
MAASAAVSSALPRRETDVALFLPALSGGGAERVILNLSAALADRGYAVDLVIAVRTGEYLANVPETVRLVSLDENTGDRQRA